ncbi:MAG: serine/threonine-protein kinase, partial [Thermoanaerobaculia bacterium]
MIGTQIGSWIIESPLGKGGMGQVYLARHKSLDTLAAVKVLAPTLDEEEFRSRFFQEAKSQARLRHPNIAHVLDHIEQDGQWFLVVEYMERGSLADRLLSLTQPLPAHGAITYSRQALAGLGHAHEHGVVHRDVKPANLLLNERDEVAVTDFGIAMVEGEHRLTGTGLAVGTPRYMSPEQIMDPKGVDHRCDIYSMGIVLYQLLLGRVPFESDSNFEIQRAQVYETPPPMREIDPQIPPQLERIVLRALAKKPEERYGSCAEFAQALTAWFATSPPQRAPGVHYDPTLIVPGEGPALEPGEAPTLAPDRLLEPT